MQAVGMSAQTAVTPAWGFGWGGSVGMVLEGGYLHDRPLRGVVYPSCFSRFPSMAGGAEEVYLCSAGEPPQERSPRRKW